MNTSTRTVLVVALVLLAGACLWAIGLAAPGAAPLAGGAPTVVAYQGEVRMGGSPYTGAGYFKFAVVNTSGDASYWSNDGTSSGGGAPSASVQLAVSEGLFSVLLGDTSVAGMTQPLAADVFGQPDRTLRVWFSSDNSTFDLLVPDTRIAAVPYALQAQEAANADTVDGWHASQLTAQYDNLVVVAKLWGDYSSVQAAINSIADASAGNPYLVWVAPGVYVEQVTMKPHVHLQGAGQEATIIHSSASSGDWPPTQATLVMASDTSLRDLTVTNNGTGTRNVAVLAPDTANAHLADVTARTFGSGQINYALFVSGGSAEVSLQQVSALAENGDDNYGLYSFLGAAVALGGGSFTARGGTYAYGISIGSSGSTLEAENVIALGENASNQNTGLRNHDSATAVLHGGSFTGRGGTYALGIFNTGSGTTLEAEDSRALGENGDDSYGLGDADGAAATLRGGSFTARGGTSTYGIHTSGSNTTLAAESVSALAENGSMDNYGLFNGDDAATTLLGGAFTANGGEIATGIHNYGSSTTLETESVAALGTDSSVYNYGLYNEAATATLHGGSSIARGGLHAYGIYNAVPGALLATESVAVLGENGIGDNYGLGNAVGAMAVLRGGSFTGQGGGIDRGIHNSGSAAAIVTQSVLEGETYSVHLESGSVNISNSRLVGTVNGTVTCVAVSRGSTFSANGCP